MNIPQDTQDRLWWLIIEVDYDTSRIVIGEHEISDQCLTLYLEDKNDFKNHIDDCVKVEIQMDDFKKIIKDGGFNSYDGTKMHPKKKFVYKTRIQINEPLAWYNDDATIVEQGWVRDAALRELLQHLLTSNAEKII